MKNLSNILVMTDTSEFPFRRNYYSSVAAACDKWLQRRGVEGTATAKELAKHRYHAKPRK
jgi:hypothetical protein